ncbi:hypothetical protein FACS1894204_01110 [Synergistales bacterium]|nr:hypothetical protein AGMMS49957_15760 [Synergistales bacterium]GHV44267.1 hypothetical protein FACS1894204_01110 [Synergistales bacterium]
MKKIFLFLLSAAFFIISRESYAAAPKLSAEFMKGTWLSSEPSHEGTTSLLEFSDGKYSFFEIAKPEGRSFKQTGELWASGHIGHSTQADPPAVYSVKGDVLIWYFKSRVTVVDANTVIMTDVEYGDRNKYFRALDDKETVRSISRREAKSPRLPKLSMEYLVGEWIGPLRGDGSRSRHIFYRDGTGLDDSCMPPKGDNTLGGYSHGTWRLGLTDHRTAGDYKLRKHRFLSANDIMFTYTYPNGQTWENGASFRVIDENEMEEYSLLNGKYIWRYRFHRVR